MTIENECELLTRQRWQSSLALFAYIMKPQIQAKGIHIFILVLMILGIIFLSVGYSIAESQGMTVCAMEIPGFIKLSETYGFNHVDVSACFEGRGLG